MTSLKEIIDGLNKKIDPDTLCLFWDEIEAVFAREIEKGPDREDRIPTLRKARKALYKAAKRAAKGKPLKTMNLDNLQEIEE